MEGYEPTQDVQLDPFIFNKNVNKLRALYILKMGI